MVEKRGPVSQQTGDDSLIYTNSAMIDGVTIMLNYKPSESAALESTTGIGIAYTGMEGLNVGMAREDNNTAAAGVRKYCYVCNIRYGCIHNWYSEKRHLTVKQQTADTDFEAWGVSYAISEDVSVSYGSSTVEFENTSNSDQEAQAIGVSWTNGSMSITASRHDIDNVTGTATDDRDATEVNLTFAF